MNTSLFWLTHHLSYQISLLELIEFLKDKPSDKTCYFLYNTLVDVIRNKDYTKAQLEHLNAFDVLTYSHFDTSIDAKISLKSNLSKTLDYLSMTASPADLFTSAPFIIHNVYHDENNDIHQQVLSFSKDFDCQCDDSALIKKSWGNTPLVLACKIGNSSTAIKLLKAHLEYQIDVNEPDENGMTSLHWACFFRDEVLIKELLNAGADIAVQNHQNLIPLDLYDLEIPHDLQIVHKQSVSGIYQMKHIPLIKESSNFFKEHEKLNCLIDIIFHMDQIAFHQMGIEHHKLCHQKHCFTQTSQFNAHFEIYIFFHFYSFIRHRNLKPKQAELLQMLEIKKAYISEPAAQANQNSSTSAESSYFSSLDLINIILNFLNCLINFCQSSSISNVRFRH